MKHNDKLTCPNCGDQFEKSEAAWVVCNDCGEIFGPGENWTKHGPGLRRGTENTKRVWPCNTGTYKYTEEAAKELQREIRNE